MTASHDRLIVLLVILTGALAPPAAAQSAALLTKYSYSQQTSQTVVVPYQSASLSPFNFRASISGTPTSPTGPISVTPPNGSVALPLAYDAGSQFWILSQNFASQAALTAAFPNGNYVYTFGGRSVSVPFSGDLFPAPPLASAPNGTWSAGVLALDPTRSQTITTNFGQDFLSGRSGLSIDVFVGGSSVHVDTGSAANQPQLSLTIPANTLVPGGIYTATIEARRFITLDGTSAPGYAIASTYVANTNFVINAGLPVFTLQPTSVTVATGSTVVLNAIASPGNVYFWQRDGTRITLASANPTLVLSGTSAVPGTYTCVANNNLGATTSAAAVVTFTNTNNPGRLINLSILSPLVSGETMTLGTALGGTGTTGSKALLARAVGPSLAQLGVSGALPDPQMSLIASANGTLVASNNDWLGDTNLTNAFAQVGAFSYAAASSKDAAIFQPNLTPGNYTVRVSDTGVGAGTVIAELYDSTPLSAFTASTPRLINVSVLKQIASGNTLTAGFVVGGSTAKTVLIRAIGPGLAQFGLTGTMSDPQLALFNGSSKIAENDNWGGDTQITTVGTAVGAFSISNPSSKDAMLLVTLAPGNYSAQITGAAGGGTALVEIYEVP